MLSNIIKAPFNIFYYGFANSFQSARHLYSAVTSSKLVGLLSVCGVGIYSYASWYEYKYMANIIKQWRAYNRVFSKLESVTSIEEFAVQSETNPMCRIENVFKYDQLFCVDPSKVLSESLDVGQSALLSYISLWLFKRIALNTTKDLLSYAFKDKMVENWLKQRNNQLALRIINPVSADQARYIVNKYAEDYVSGIVERLSTLSDIIVMCGKAYSVYETSSALSRSGLSYSFLNYTASITIGYVAVSVILNLLHRRVLKSSEEQNIRHEENIIFNSSNALQVEAAQARQVELGGLRSGLKGKFLYGLGLSGVEKVIGIVGISYVRALDFAVLRKSISSIVLNPFLYSQIQVATDMASQVSASFMELFDKIMSTASVETNLSKILNFKQSIEIYADLLANNKALTFTRDRQGEVEVKNLELQKPLSSEEIKSKTSPKILVSGLNFKFRKGEITAITGESGSGKSCLFNLMFGINPFAKGEINVGDESNVVYVPQHAVFKSDMSFKDTLRYSLDKELSLLSDNQRTALNNKIVKCISILKLEDVVKAEQNNKAWASSLSGGEKQRVALLQAVIRLTVKRMLEPESTIMLMLDESLGALDPKNKSGAFNLIKEEVKNNNAVALHIDHSEPEIIRARYNEANVLDFDKLKEQLKDQSIGR